MRLDWTLFLPSSFLLLDWDSVYIMGWLGWWEGVLELLYEGDEERKSIDE